MTPSRWALVVGLLGLLACDPVWHVRAKVRDAADKPVVGATIALACLATSAREGVGVSATTDDDGAAQVAGFGTDLPIGCDLFVAKPGFALLQVPYRALCPTGSGCDRTLDLALVIESAERWGDSKKPAVPRAPW